MATLPQDQTKVVQADAAGTTERPTVGSFAQGQDGMYYGFGKNAIGSGASTTDTQSPYYSRYNLGSTNNADKPIVPETEDQIIARKTAQAQGQIDAINKTYDRELADQKIINEGRDRSTASVNTLSGLAGSTEANVTQGKTTAINQADNQKIEEERNLQIQTLLGNIRASAVEEARNARLDARQANQDTIAERTRRQTEATTQLTNLAKTGVTANGLKTTDPQSYDYLVKTFGGEEQVNAMFTLNRPAETILDKQIKNGKYVIAYQNPLDGKVRIETLDLGLPPEYSKTIDAGNRILAIPDGWDGDPSKLITINKGLTPKEQQDAASAAATPDAAKQRMNEALALAKQLREDTAVGKGSAVGASLAKLAPGAESLGLQPDRAGYEAKLNTLKSNLTLDNLKLLKGAMSDKDVLFLQSVGSSLDTGMSEKQFNAELDRIITKLQDSGATGPDTQNDTSSDRVTVVSPSGDVGTIPRSQLSEALSQGYKQK